MRRATFSEVASHDVEEIWLRIAADNFAAAERWNDHIRATVDRLAAESHFFTGHRRSDIKNPVLLCWTEGAYVIVYRWVADGLEVSRVLHGARNFERINWT